MGEALHTIRKKGLGAQIVYFYVVDAIDRLLGVVPTRRLLTEDLNTKIGDIMVKHVVTLSSQATILDACEMFVLYKFLALPVVDEQRRLLGVVDIHLFTEEVFDLLEREQTDTVFEYIGFKISQVREASPVKIFRYRFPWLLATITSGLLCAVLTSVFKYTLESSILLAFFLALALGLGESVAIQSMTVAIQNLRFGRPTLNWYLKNLGKEVMTAVLLGIASGFLVFLLTLFWDRNSLVGLAIGTGICFSIVSACFFGLTVPTLLHRLRMDPKISAGPVALALTDVSTVLFYFLSAVVWLD